MKGHVTVKKVNNTKAFSDHLLHVSMALLAVVNVCYYLFVFIR